MPQLLPEPWEQRLQWMAPGNMSPVWEESFTTSWRKGFIKYQAVCPALLGTAHPRVALFRGSGKAELRISVGCGSQISTMETAQLLSVPLLACMQGEKTHCLWQWLPLRSTYINVLRSWAPLSIQCPQKPHSNQHIWHVLDWAPSPMAPDWQLLEIFFEIWPKATADL